MPGDTCIVCGNTRKKDKSISMHRFPRDDGRRKRWVEALDLEDMDIKDHYRVCSRHFPDADATKDPQLTLGKLLGYLLRSTLLLTAHPQTYSVQLAYTATKIQM